MSIEGPKGENSRSTEPTGWTPGNKYFKEFVRVLHVWSTWWGVHIVALLGAAGGAWMGRECPTGLEAAVRVAASLVGVIIGAVLAALAMITRASDTEFLKKAKGAGILPISQYLTPFFTVIFFGILSSVSLILVAAVGGFASTGWRTGLGAAAGFFTFWTLAGLLPALGALVVFTRLVEIAAAIRLPDEK